MCAASAIFAGEESDSLTAAFKDVSDLLVSVEVLLKEALELLLIARELVWRDSDDVLQDTGAVLKALDNFCCDQLQVEG